MIEERFELACERIQEIRKEELLKQPFQQYFQEVAKFIIAMEELWIECKEKDYETTTLNALQNSNKNIYSDILPENYQNSYANPEVANARLGDEFGPLLCFLYTEMRSIIPCCFEQDLERFVIRVELFLEVYHAFADSFAEFEKEPSKEEIREIIYWFVNDYSEVEIARRVKEQLDPNGQFALSIIMNSNLEDIKYLYQFGEYITENEIRTALFLNTLPQNMINKMADTFTEGFRMGFVNGNKDLSKKKVINLRYTLGFERIVKKAIANFARMGLQVTIYRAGVSCFHRRGTAKIGYYGAIANKQYDYDHKEDEALYLDKKLINRRLEVLKEAYEEQKDWAAVFAGPACMEIFGDEPFAPQAKKAALALTQEQQELAVEYASKSGQLINEYIKGEERSFTIIAFPTPAIGQDFEEIFQETVRINTLDYSLYEKIQQTLIDVLDQGDKVIVKGTNGNKTDLQVTLHELNNPATETIFENCVADVNIPVGEVFTSPVLKGTTGTLFVSKVYLNELEYKDLTIELKDGMIVNYSCSNFETEEENKKYIKDNILYHHETLPIGEFAIGTNTTAYVVAKKYQLEDKLPILIAEKMGPHFAFGDTCYAHSEDVPVKNPNGKEIIARDNEVSSKRKTNIEEAYYHCHTDITIPYDELGKLSVVRKDGSEEVLIENGRFVLSGVEELNEPF